MKDFLKEVKEYFENTPQDKIDSDWSKYEEFDQVGPTINEFLEQNISNGKRPPKKKDKICGGGYDRLPII